MAGWRDFSGGISDEDTKDLDERLAAFEMSLDAVNAAQSDAVAAIISLKSWAKLSVKVLEVTEPILAQYLIQKKVEDARKAEEKEAEKVKAKAEEKAKIDEIILSEVDFGGEGE